MMLTCAFMIGWATSIRFTYGDWAENIDFRDYTILKKDELAQRERIEAWKEVIDEDPALAYKAEEDMLEEYEELRDDHEEFLEQNGPHSVMDTGIDSTLLFVLVPPIAMFAAVFPDLTESIVDFFDEKEEDSEEVEVCCKCGESSTEWSSGDTDEEYEDELELDWQIVN